MQEYWTDRGFGLACGASVNVCVLVNLGSAVYVPALLISCLCQPKLRVSFLCSCSYVNPLCSSQCFDCGRLTDYATVLGMSVCVSCHCDMYSALLLDKLAKGQRHQVHGHRDGFH